MDGEKGRRQGWEEENVGGETFPVCGSGKGEFLDCLFFVFCASLLSLIHGSDAYYVRMRTFGG